MDKHANQYSLRHRIGRLACAIPLALSGVLLSAAPAAAAPPIVTVPGVDIPLPAGTGCPNFDLLIHSEDVNRVVKEFRDRNGNLVRTISAGRGAIETFTNVDTGVSVTFKTGGSVMRITRNPGGITSTMTLTGHNVFILFATDNPPGPKSTLYIGKVVLTVDDAFNVFDIKQTSGTQVDICAILSV